MRPTEKACSTEYIAEQGNSMYVFAVTTYPSIRTTKNTIDGGFITIALLHSDCWGDVHTFRARFKRAWKAFWGCPDSEFFMESPEDVDNLIPALQRAKELAFKEV